jgi:hypothetical protein
MSGFLEYNVKAKQIMVEGKCCCNVPNNEECRNASN